MWGEIKLPSHQPHSQPHPYPPKNLVFVFEIRKAPLKTLLAQFCSLGGLLQKLFKSTRKGGGGRFAPPSTLPLNPPLNVVLAVNHYLSCYLSFIEELKILLLVFLFLLRLLAMLLKKFSFYFPRHQLFARTL